MGKSILILRLFIGLRLIYGVIDNVFYWEDMLEFVEFLKNHSFPFPRLSAIASVYAQLIGGLGLILGFQTKLFAWIILINFIVAIIGIHLKIGDSIEGMTPALAMLFVSWSLLLSGPGRYSIDYIREKRRTSGEVKIR